MKTVNGRATRNGLAKRRREWQAARKIESLAKRLFGDLEIFEAPMPAGHLESLGILRNGKLAVIGSGGQAKVKELSLTEACEWCAETIAALDRTDDDCIQTRFGLPEFFKLIGKALTEKKGARL